MNKKHLIYFLILIELIVFSGIVYYAFLRKSTSFDQWAGILSSQKMTVSSSVMEDDILRNTLSINAESLQNAAQSEAIFLKINQKSSKAILASKIFSQGEQYRRLCCFSEAVVSYQKAQIIFEEIKEYKAAMACMLVIGESYRVLDDKKNARVYFEKVLSYQSVVVSYYLEARALRGLAQVEIDKNKSKNYFEKSYALFKISNNYAGMASILKIYGDIDRHQGLYESAQHFYKQAIDFFRLVDDSLGEGNCLRGYGHLYLSKGEYKPAYLYYEKSLKIFKALNQQRVLAKTLRGLGDYATYFQNKKDALDSYQKAYEIFKAVKDKKGKGEVFYGLGIFYRKTGELDKSLHFLKKASKIFGKLDDLLWSQYNFLEMAITLYKKKDYKKSKDIVLEILKNPFNAKNKLILGRSYFVLARIEKATSGINQKHLQKALYYFESIQNRKGIAFCLMLRSNIGYYQSNNFLQSFNDAQDAYKIFQKLGNYYKQSSALRQMADAARMIKPCEEAMSYYQKSLKLLGDDHDQKRAKIFLGMGFLMSQIEDQASALDFYKKASEFAGSARKIFARAQTGIAGIYIAQNKKEAAKRLLLDSFKISQAEKDSQGVAFSLREQAWVAYYSGDIKAAKKLIKESLEAAGNYYLEKALSLWLQSRLLLFEGCLMKALDIAKEAVSIFEELKTIRYHKRASLYLASLYSFAGYYDLCEKNLYMCMDDLEENTRFMAENSLQFARLYLQQGDLEKTLNYCDKASLHIKDSKKHQSLYNFSLGRFFLLVGDFKKSKETLVHAFVLAESMENSILQLEIAYELGDVLIRLGEIDQAQKCINLLEKFSSQSHFIEMQSLILKGKILLEESKIKEAILTYKKALKLFNVIDNPQYKALILCRLGDIFVGEKRYKEGEDCYKKAMTIYEGFSGAYRQIYALYKLGCLFIHKGQYTIAEKYLQKAYKYAETRRCLSLKIRILYALSHVFDEVKSTHYRKKFENFLNFFSSIDRIDLQKFRNYIQKGHDLEFKN